jgi:hypothetical protein
MSASVTLYDGTIIRVACKQCSCEMVCGCPSGADYPVLHVSIYGLVECDKSAVVTATYNIGLAAWIGSAAWSGMGNEIHVRLTCTADSFYVAVYTTFNGSPTICNFGSTPSLSYTCSVLLYHFELVDTGNVLLCCGGGLFPQTLGIDVTL